MPGSKAMTPQEKQVVKDLANGLLHGRFEGNQSRFAEALDVSQPQVSEILSGAKGAGGKSLIRMFTMLFPEWLNGSLTVPKVVDTLAMARKAAQNLVNSDLAKPAAAWAIMEEVTLNNPSVDGFYTEAKRLLGGDPQSPGPREEQILTTKPGPTKRKRKSS